MWMLRVSFNFRYNNNNSYFCFPSSFVVATNFLWAIEEHDACCVNYQHDRVLGVDLAYSQQQIKKAARVNERQNQSAYFPNIRKDISLEERTV